MSGVMHNAANRFPIIHQSMLGYRLYSTYWGTAGKCIRTVKLKKLVTSNFHDFSPWATGNFLSMF